MKVATFIAVCALAVGMVLAGEQAKDASQGNEQLVTVAAKGLGTTVEAARKDASRAAIEQAVGQFVDAETIAENDNIVKDRILTYSAAIIESLEVVGDPGKNDDGLFVVNVLAKIKKTKLQEKLKAENIPVKVDGTSLAAKLGSIQDEKESTLAILKEAVKGWPVDQLRCEFEKTEDGKPKFEFGSDGEVFINVTVSHDRVAYSAFAKNLMDKLDALGFEYKEENDDVGRLCNYDVDYTGQNTIEVPVCFPVRKSANAAKVRTYKKTCDYVDEINRTLYSHGSRVSFELLAGEELLASARSIWAGCYHFNQLLRSNVSEGLSLNYKISLGKIAKEDLADVTDLKYKVEYNN